MYLLLSLGAASILASTLIYIMVAGTPVEQDFDAPFSDDPRPADALRDEMNRVSHAGRGTS